ncbi:hypothetical protein JXO52_16430 [bacterium]|nr:hypothetical protein [bacterium]
MKIRQVTIIAIAALITGSLLVPGAEAGSIFTSRGVGFYARFGNVRGMGMGGVSIGLSSPTRICSVNPASLYAIANTRITLQLYSDYNTVKDQFASASSMYTNFDGFSLAVPLGSGTGFMVSMHPLTRMDFFLQSDQEIAGESYLKSVEGSGGINQFSLSFYWAVQKWISLGVTTSFNFGLLKETWKVDYSSSSIATSRDVYYYKYRGVGLTLAAMVHPAPGLEIGALYTPAAELKSRNDLYTIFTHEHTRSTGTLTFPSEWGVGASYRAYPHLLLGADYHARNWSDLAYDGESLAGVRNTKRISGGVELFNSGDVDDPFWKRMAYRFGFTTEPFAYTDLDGNTIDERWLTFGIGLPAFFDISHIDLSVAIGKRGNLADNGLSETMIRVGASITGGEKWFTRRY